MATAIANDSWDWGCTSPQVGVPSVLALYAGTVSSLGLGFLVSTKHLLAFTISFLIFTVGVSAFRAKQRRGYGPFVLGIIGSAGLEWKILLGIEHDDL